MHIHVKQQLKIIEQQYSYYSHIKSHVLKSYESYHDATAWQIY